MVAWTTTPWTLPSNLALCVNADFEYVKVCRCGEMYNAFILLFPDAFNPNFCKTYCLRSRRVLAMDFATERMHIVSGSL